MTTERDTTRIVRSWLRSDKHESADRVLDNVLAVLDATPQRRSWWPARRSTDMNTFAKLAIAAAAVVVIAVVGISLLPASGGVGGGGPAASPSPSPTPTAPPSPSPTPVAYAYPPSGELEVGSRHSLTVDGVPFSLTVPASGWMSTGSAMGLNKESGGAPSSAWMPIWTPDNVYADPCTQSRLDPPPGPSAADLAAAISTVPGTDAMGPSDVTVGGRAAKLVVLTIREDIGCDPQQFYLWYNEGPGDDCSGDEECGRYATALGDTIRVWIVDVDGARLFFEAETGKDAGPEIEQEIQQIIDSIQFE